jgi:hypothetical protein
VPMYSGWQSASPSAGLQVARTFTLHGGAPGESAVHHARVEAGEVRRG